MQSGSDSPTVPAWLAAKRKPPCRNSPRSVITPTPISRQKSSSLDNGLARLSAKVGDLPQAKKFCRDACDADATNLAIREMLMELTFQSNDVAGMTDVLKQIKTLEGEGPYWHYGQAALSLLTNSTNTAAAFEHLGVARDLRPNWSRVPMLMGQIHDRHGEIESAIDDYIKAIDLGERSPAAVRRTVELLYSASELCGSRSTAEKDRTVVGQSPMQTFVKSSRSLP